MWLELYKAVSECLPRDAVEQPDIRLQNRILITKFTPRRYADLGAWYSGLSTEAKELLSEQDRKAPPSGPGWIVTLEGDHYHDGTLGKGFAAMPPGGDPAQNLILFGRGYLREQFLKKLQLWAVPSHDSSGKSKSAELGSRTRPSSFARSRYPKCATRPGQTEIPQMAGRDGRPGSRIVGSQQRTFKLNRTGVATKEEDGTAAP